MLESFRKWSGKKLRLTVNPNKSAVDRPRKRKFLGFTFTTRRKRSISQQAPKKFKARVHKLTQRNQGSSLQRAISELRSYLIGWRGY